MIYHFKSLVLVRKGRAFYATLYQEVFLGNPGGGRVLKLAIYVLYSIKRQDAEKKREINCPAFLDFVFLWC